MLVLSRRPNEKIVLPDLQICVHVLEIKGDRVRLGFEAPASVTILRGELVPSSESPAPVASSETPENAPAALAAAPPLLRKPCSATLRTAMASKG